MEAISEQVLPSHPDASIASASFLSSAEFTSLVDIEDLALAVERCESTRYGDEVGPGSNKVPCGARVQIVTRDSEASVEDMRAQTVEWLRALHVNEAVSVRCGPWELVANRLSVPGPRKRS